MGLNVGIGWLVISVLVSLHGFRENRINAAGLGKIFLEGFPLSATSQERQGLK